MDRRRVTLIILCICSLLCCFLAPNMLYAEQTDDDLFPSGDISSPVYSQYKKEYYRLDYVAPKDADWDQVIMVGIVQFLNFLLSLSWRLYLFLVELTIHMVNWVYDPAMLDKLIGLISNLMPNIIANVWKPLWFIVATIGLTAAVLIWGKGNTNRSFLSVGTIILLVAFVPSLLVYMPTVLSNANTVVTQMGAEIMQKMISSEIKKVEKQMEAQQKKELEQKETKDDAKSNPTTADQASEGNFKNPFDQWGNSVLSGVHAIDDSLWKSLVVQPYWIANFGSTSLGQAKWTALLSNKDDIGYREKWLRDNGKIEENSGVTSDPNYKIFTTDGFGERFYKATMAIILSLVPLVVIVGIAIIVLTWKAKAIGRTIFLVFDCLMALYPGYGMSAVIQATVKVVISFLMVFFYTVSLACFLALWAKIQDPTVFTDATFGDRILLIIILLIGLWAGVQGVQRRLGNIPSLFGGSIQVDEGQQGLGLMRRMVTMSAVKGASNLVGRPVGKLLDTTKKYALKKPAKFAGNWAKKQARKGLQKAGQYINKIDAVQRTKGSLSFFNPKQQKLTANLSKDASNAYKQMTRKGYNPAKEKSRQRFVRKHPDLEVPVQELADWTKQKAYFQVIETPDLETGDRIPPAPPPRTSPEYMAWKSSDKLQEHWNLWTNAVKNVRGGRSQIYQQQKRKYDQSMARRLFTARPQFKEPNKREYLREYRNLMGQKKVKK